MTADKNTRHKKLIMTVTNEVLEVGRGLERLRNVYLAFALWHTQVKITINLGIVHLSLVPTCLQSFIHPNI